MSQEPLSSPAGFDQYASTYDAVLAKGISVSGEDKNYFARRRIEWLRGRLNPIDLPLAAAMEFGCGTGSNVPFLIELLGAGSVLGVDVSTKSLEFARKAFGSGRAQFLQLSEYEPSCDMDLAFCNGVFHHIAATERSTWLSYIFRSLRPGGVFALWENNPWNPGTRYVMRRIAFDRDAKVLSPPETRRLMKAAGFQIVRTDFLFIFPRPLAWFRTFEPHLAWWPLGAQYQILARKPFGRTRTRSCD
jgi:SAM-dependent methyltransferase